MTKLSEKAKELIIENNLNDLDDGLDIFGEIDTIIIPVSVYNVYYDMCDLIVEKYKLNEIDNINKKVIDCNDDMMNGYSACVAIIFNNYPALVFNVNLKLIQTEMFDKYIDDIINEWKSKIK